MKDSLIKLYARLDECADYKKQIQEEERTVKRAIKSIKELMSEEELAEFEEELEEAEDTEETEENEEAEAEAATLDIESDSE